MFVISITDSIYLTEMLQIQQTGSALEVPTLKRKLMKPLEAQLYMRNLALPFMQLQTHVDNRRGTRFRTRQWDIKLQKFIGK